MTTSSIQDLITFHSRKLLLYPSFNQSSTSTSTSTSVARPPGGHDLLEPTPGGNSFDADVVLVFTVLLCALICSLGLNAIIKCALKCSRMVSSDDYSGNGTRSGSIEGKLANPGINKKALKMFPEVSYSADLKIPGLESECVICLMEFSPGEKIRVLPNCNHGFHVKCIDRWLNCNSSCPTCRLCLTKTCNKIIGCGDAHLSQSSNSALPRGAPQQVITNITSLEPEGMIHNFRS